MDQIITPEQHKNIINRGLPKTGQVTVYYGKDDGFFQAGWWRGRLNANNKTRFISKTIGGDDVVIDRATGLMWAADGNGRGCNSGGTENWEDAVYFGGHLNFAGFNDWRLPNARELFSILDFAETDPSIDESFFPNTVSNKYWTSTTDVNDTLNAWQASFKSWGFWQEAKTEQYYLRSVRGGL